MSKGIFGLRGKALEILIALVGATAFLLQGYDQAVANGLLTLDTFITTFPQTDTINTTGAQKSHNANIQGVTVAIYEVGCALGALSCAITGDILGRRRTIFMAGILAIIGIIMQASAFSLVQLIVGRAVTGLGVGAFTATIPMYVGETAATEMRGRLTLLEGFFAAAGLALAGWVDFGFYYAKGPVNWRFPIAFQILFAIFVISIILLLPESPRWLVKKDRFEEAAEILAQLSDLSPTSDVVAQDIALIRHSLADEVPGHGISNSPFSRTENRHLHRTVLAVALAMFAQMSGINIVTFYSDTVFQSVLGYSGTLARIISGCITTGFLIGAGIGILLIDRVGRRKLMLATIAVLALCQACMAGLSSDLLNPAAGKASILFYFLAMFCFPIGLFLIPFMYAAEIAPLRTRASVTAMAAATQWLFNFLVVEVTPVGFANIQWRYYLVYTVMTVFAFVIVLLFYPETQGRSLEEIDEIFIRSKSIFDTVRVARELPLHAEIRAVAKNADELEIGDESGRAMEKC